MITTRACNPLHRSASTCASSVKSHHWGYKRMKEGGILRHWILRRVSFKKKTKEDRSISDGGNSRGMYL